jgi:hypothetical protein
MTQYITILMLLFNDYFPSPFKKKATGECDSREKRGAARVDREHRYGS